MHGGNRCTSGLLFLDWANNFFLHVLPILHELLSHMHLCYCSVNARQQKFPLFMPKLFGSKDNSPSMCDCQSGNCSHIFTQWSKRDLIPPFSYLCEKVYSLHLECLTRMHLTSRSLTKKKKKKGVWRSLSYFCVFFSPPQTISDFYIKRRVMACENFYSWNMFHLEDRGENIND